MLTRLVDYRVPIEVKALSRKTSVEVCRMVHGGE